MTTVAAMAPLSLGAITVQQVIELERWTHPPEGLFPAITPALVEEARRTLDARSVDPMTGDFILSVHSYLVRTRERLILIDSCNGNHKPRPAFPAVDQLDTPYLTRLADAGVRPEDVDVVLCTHLHPDHVGWNTQLVDGRWAPTFPNARYVFSRQEYEDMTAYHQAGPYREQLEIDLDSSFCDSVLPVVEAGQADLVDAGHVIEHELGHGVRLEHAPGHTRGHAVVHLEGGGRRAIATGDAFHHLLQLNHPELPQGADFDVVQSEATRRRLYQASLDTGAIILPGHFPAPTAGRVVEAAGRLVFQPIDGTA